MKKILSILILALLPFILGQFQLPNLQVFKSKAISSRGIYITSWSAQSKSKMIYIKNIMKTRNLNTIVVDVNYIIDPELLPFIKHRKFDRHFEIKPIEWLKNFVKEFHDEGYVVTARIVVFKDDHLAIARPDLAVRLPGGKLYRDRKGGYWIDPYSDEARLYKAAMAEIAAASGVDEVQFDYIRFPAEGAAQYAVFPHKKEAVSRVDIICQFLKEAKERIDKYNVSLAVDIFGVAAWQSKTDIDSLGQDLKQMAKYLDVLSPMLYPSHFHYGYDGVPNPGSEPYYFMSTGVRKSLEILSGEATALVPWIQGFNLRSPNYGPGYIRAQVEACRDHGVRRFLIWNARNVYDTVPEDL